MSPKVNGIGGKREFAASWNGPLRSGRARPSTSHQNRSNFAMVTTALASICGPTLDIAIKTREIVPDLGIPEILHCGREASLAKLHRSAPKRMARPVARCAQTLQFCSVGFLRIADLGVDSGRGQDCITRPSRPPTSLQFEPCGHHRGDDERGVPVWWL